MDQNKAPVKKNHPILRAFLGSFGAAALAVLGIVLMNLDRTRAAYGYTAFIILPLAMGLVIACFSRSFWVTLASVLFSILLSLVLLLISGLEGVVCILMAFPLFFACTAVGVVLGVGISWLVRKSTGPRSNVVLLPLIGLSSIFGVERIEDRLGAGDRLETITTTRIIAGTPERAWERILSIDEVSGTKPFLLRIGLPVPKSCAMEGNGLGARRICYFENGSIEEEVTTWEPGQRLDLRIIRSTLPGRHWLQFKSASYQLERVSPTDAPHSNHNDFQQAAPGMVLAILRRDGRPNGTSICV